MTEPEDDPKDPFRLGDDPGWRPGPRDGRPDGLVALRFVFLSFCVALLMIGVVVGLLASSVAERDQVTSGPVALVGVVVIGVLSLVLVRFVPIRLDCADELALARSWRGRFFARMAASEVSALAGFIAFHLTGVPALYPVGLVFTAIGFAVSGPLRANLVRDQEALALRACAIPLVPALRRPVPRAADGRRGR